MEIPRLKVAWEQLRNVFVLAYSLVVMATSLPIATYIPSVVVIPYLLVVPGYFVAIILHHTDSALETLFYSFAWSVTLTISVYSVGTIAEGTAFFPVVLIVPALTLVLLAFDHFHTRRAGAVQGGGPAV